MKNQNLYEANRWLKQAEYDLKVARWNAKGGFWSQACFMSQQSGEKALKAFCFAHGERNVIGHSLLVLVRRCTKHIKTFEALAEDCKRLDKYYIIARYPNGLPDLTPAEYFDESEAMKALRYSNGIVKFVKERLKSKRK